MEATLPTREEFERAAELVRPVVLRTPLVPLHDPGGELDVLLKPEIHQVVGSFKIRGVYHAVARMEAGTRARGISTVSAGNTAQALAWAGRHFGVPSRSVMPEGAPASKVAAVRAWGGTPVPVPTDELFRYMRAVSYTHLTLPTIYSV